jgi:glycosyltransferase involved in cell wall biosynthesis
MFADVPILAADYPEVRRLVKRHEIGILFDPYDPKSIAAGIRRLKEEPGLAEGIRRRMPEAAINYDPNKEWGKLVTLYRTLADKGSLRSLAYPLGRDE